MCSIKLRKLQYIKEQDFPKIFFAGEEKSVRWFYSLFLADLVFMLSCSMPEFHGYSGGKALYIKRGSVML
jgi:hypothetical protein